MFYVCFLFVRVYVCLEANVHTYACEGTVFLETMGTIVCILGPGEHPCISPNSACTEGFLRC